MIIRKKINTRVLMLYDELESGVYAADFFDHITKMLREELQLNFDIWNFEALHVPMIRDSVYNTAVDADIIAFAVQENHPIADWIMDWIKSWVPFKKSDSCAFVGIFINPDTYPYITPDSPNLMRLRDIADNGHLAFFTQKTFYTDPVAIQNN